MAIIKSGATSDQLTIDVTSKAARATLYDTTGALLTKQDGVASSFSPNSSQVLPVGGSEYKTARSLRLLPDGSIPGNGQALLFWDGVEGATLNTLAWTNTNTTMTVAQASGGITLNNSAITTTTTGNLLLSNRSFQILSRGRLLFRSRQRHTTHGSNNLIELGFGTSVSATAAGIGVGAVWRKDGTGQYVPVVSIANGSETLGTPIANATWVSSVGVSEYANFEVELAESQARFRAYTSAGVLVSEQIVDLGTTTTGFTATHVQAFIRLYHAGAAGAATQAIIGQTAVYSVDSDSDRPWRDRNSGFGLNSLASPTAYTQLANLTNSAAPTTRTLANGTAAESTLGGLLVANSMAGAATDLIMFGWTNPSPYTFYFTGVRIDPPLNQVAAVATTDTLFVYGMSINNTAPTNLGSGTHFRVALGGFHIGAVGLAANKQFSGTPVIWQPLVPLVVYPGRGITIFARALVGTATATETFLWSTLVDGFFE